MTSSRETELDDSATSAQTAAGVEAERTKDVQALPGGPAQDIAMFALVPHASVDPAAIRKRLHALVHFVADIDQSDVSSSRLHLLADSRCSTAYHEAGHAVAHVRCGTELNIATTVQDEGSLGAVTLTGICDEDLICYYAGYAVDLAHGHEVLFNDLYALVDVADGESTLDDLDRSRAYSRFANDLARRPSARVHASK